MSETRKEPSDDVKYGEYELLWRNKWIAAHARTFDEFIQAFEDAAKELKAMQADGVALSDDGAIADDYASFRTNDPKIAKKYGFEKLEFEDDEEA